MNTQPSTDLHFERCCLTDSRNKGNRGTEYYGRVGSMKENCSLMTDMLHCNVNYRGLGTGGRLVRSTPPLASGSDAMLKRNYTHIKEGIERYKYRYQSLAENTQTLLSVTPTMSFIC